MLRDVSSVLVNFLRWWVAELRAVFAPPAAQGSDQYAQRIVLSVLPEHFRLVDERRKRASSKIGEYKTLNTAALALARAAEKRPAVPVGIRFSNNDFFVRRIELPASARNDVGKVLDLELERTTPFRHADVYAAHFVGDNAQGEGQKLIVQQVVIKKATVEKVISALEQVGVAPDFADCTTNEEEGGLPIDFLRTAEEAEAVGRGGYRLLPRLAVISLLLAATAAATALVRYQSALDEVSAAVTAARAESQIVRRTLDKSETALSQIAVVERWRQERVPAAEVLETLTQVIPDSAWLSDVRIEGGAVEVTGYAHSAARLVPLIQKSALFDRVSLTAPVMLDTRSDKERFSIRLHLRNTALPGERGEADKPMATR